MTSEETSKNKPLKSLQPHMEHMSRTTMQTIEDPKDKLFMKSIEEKEQKISFCGVGAHHKNGIAEKRIGDLQRRATTLLLHAQRG